MSRSTQYQSSNVKTLGTRTAEHFRVRVDYIYSQLEAPHVRYTCLEPEACLRCVHEDVLVVRKHYIGLFEVDSSNKTLINSQSFILDYEVVPRA